MWLKLVYINKRLELQKAEVKISNKNRSEKHAERHFLKNRHFKV